MSVFDSANLKIVEKENNKMKTAKTHQTVRTLKPVIRDTQDHAKDLAQEDVNSKAIVPTTTKMFLKQKSKCELTEKVEILENNLWEITLKFINVDQELKTIKEEVKLQDNICKKCHL